MDAAIFGLIVADIIAEPMDLRHSPPPGGLRFINSIQLTTGGNVCNTAIAMARLGMSVAACGMVGEDVLGRAILEQLRSAGLNTEAVFTTKQAQTTATVVAVEPGGERCFFHILGTTPLLDVGLFRRCIPTFRQCAWMQVGYFGLLPKSLIVDLPALLQEVRLASPGTKIALDTADPAEDLDQLVPILPHLDLFAPSRTEAAALTGLREPTKMLDVFRRHMPQGLIGIKLDSDGCLLDDGRQTVLAPAYKINVVDTTGAGDTWFAGLLVALRKNLPLEQAARLANRVAADCCMAFGASAGVRSLDETMTG